MLLNVNKLFIIYLNRVTIINDKNKEASLFLIK
jgi:hypothetical protein